MTEQMNEMVARLHKWMSENNVTANHALEIFREVANATAKEWELLSGDPKLLKGDLTGDECSAQHQAWDSLYGKLRKVKFWPFR
jgi:hypothetical protein